MEPFYHQSWFWAGFFTAIASLGGILIKEWITSKAQMRIERLKMYDSNVFSAYNDLYGFISHAYDRLWPPNEPAREFRYLMKKYYFKDIKKNMLFYCCFTGLKFEKFLEYLNLSMFVWVIQI